MSSRAIRLLLIEDNEGDARLVAIFLREVGGIVLEHAATLAAGLKRLAEGSFDAVLLDLSLPDSFGMDTVDAVHRAMPALPIILFTGSDDDAIGLEGIHHGCQDYLVKGRSDGELIRRTVLYAIERKAAILAHERSEEALRQREAMANMILDTAPEAMLVMDADGRVMRANAHAHRLLGYAPDTLVGCDLDGLVPGCCIEAVQPSTAAQPREMMGRRRDGKAFPAAVSLGPMRFGDDSFVVLSIEDLTARKATEAASRLHAAVFQHAREGIVVTDAHGVIVSVNPAFTRITGFSQAEVVGQTPRVLASYRQGKDFYQAMWETLIDAGYWTGEIWNRRKNGEIYPEWLSISAVYDTAGSVSHYVGVFLDITTMKQQEEALLHLAHHDALTGLPNRVLLADRVTKAAERTRRSGKMMAVAYLDLDGFKPVNDQFGHHAGDELLVILSRRMAQALRGGDTVARLGGDEFAVLIQDLDNEKECRAALARLLAVVGQPVELAGLTTPVSVTASLGVSLYPIDDADPETLLRHADQAMYEAKETGRNRYCIYDAEETRRVPVLLQNAERMRLALEEQQFELFYQPKVNMRLGTVIGAEALIRWRDPDRGLVSPAEFLPLIEQARLEIEVGEWVIATALAQMAEWKVAGHIIPVSVNVSARHLLSRDFAMRLATLLAEHPDVAPRMLQIEVVETTALEDVAQARAILEECRLLGVPSALDDFGTGYSSLTYLRHLPIDTLKIDQSFIRNLPNDGDDLAIIRGIIALAAGFGRMVVAEGIETRAHGEMLLQLGCEFGQGYQIARPMPAGELPDWLCHWQEQGPIFSSESLAPQPAMLI